MRPLTEFMIAGEPQRLTRRASVFYWQKRSISAVNRRKWNTRAFACFPLLSV
ncbi:hypothetical protein [Brevibacillus porteri]|uniref:hypothetical protein n=1 Tax=Brevibacillus porteri TaxID=2126350 RepID=UPI002E1DC4E2|nr:hypothetical protein [Brevibacillus porteri]